MLMEHDRFMTDTDFTPTPQDAPEVPDQDAPEITPNEAQHDRFYSSRFVIPGPPESSKDGAYLAYLQPNEHNDLALWIAPTDGGEPRRIDLPFVPIADVDPESGRHIRGPQWSPDGARIALTGPRPDGDGTTIWIVPVNLNDDAEPVAVFQPETISHHSDDESFATENDDTLPLPEDQDGSVAELSDDADHEEPGEDVAEAAADDELTDSTEPDEDEAILAATQATESRQQPYVLIEHDGSDRSPRWSPDGDLMAMVSTIDGRDVITLTATAEDAPAGIELLTWSRANDREPVWSRDGKMLAFLRTRPEGPDLADIYCFSLEKGELLNLTSEKAPVMRHSLEWVPGRNLIAYVTREGDWLGISVINADNKAGWVVTRESGDKTEPRFAQDEARLVYVRTEGFTTVLCERSLHSSSAVALDPGEGVVRYPRWLNGKRVAYGFSAPMRPFGFLVQENTAKSERNAILIAEEPSIAGRDFVQPQPFEFEVGPEETFSGMLYRGHGGGKQPAIVYLPDGALTTRRGEFQIEEQALASHGSAVLTPVVHGASGFGAAIEDDLRDFANTELEDNDIAEAGRALSREESIDAHNLVVVGHGYGGMLGLVTAGARPGVYSAVVAIDPIADWSIEIANADVAWRNWVIDRFGMPLTHADNYALRTPATFSAVLDVPILLVRTAEASESRQAQLDMLMHDMDETGITYELLEAPDEPLAATLHRIAERLVSWQHESTANDEAVVVASTGSPDIDIEPEPIEDVTDQDAAEDVEPIDDPDETDVKSD